MSKQGHSALEGRVRFNTQPQLFERTANGSKVRERCQGKDLPQRLGKAIGQNGEALISSIFLVHFKHSLPGPV
jgi:hypothetical protein